MKIKHYTIPVFIPMQACPFHCIFCDQQKISGHISIPAPEEVTQILVRHLSTIPEKNTVVEAGFFGGTFTGIAAEKQRAYLEAVQPFLKTKRISGIRLSTRPDFIDKGKLELLKSYGVTTIELGAQSMDDVVLKKAGRGHTARDTMKASLMIRNSGFRLGLQMMVGLPGDSSEKAIATAKEIVRLKAQDVRIYPLLVIKGTLLERLYRAGKYTPLTLDEAVGIVADIYKIFEDAEINIIRTGLHPSEGLISGKELVAGPFHVSFKELVMTKLWEKEFQGLIEGEETRQTLTVFVAPGQVNYASGYGAVNKNKLLDKFRKVKFKTDHALKGRLYYVDHRK